MGKVLYSVDDLSLGGYSDKLGRYSVPKFQE